MMWEVKKENRTIPAALVVLAVNTFSIFLASLILPGMKSESVPEILLAALVLTVANYVLEPVLYHLTLPINVATFGIFTLVTNGALLLAVSKISGGLHFTGRFWGFGWAVLASLLISIFRVIIRVLRPNRNS